MKQISNKEYEKYQQYQTDQTAWPDTDTGRPPCRLRRSGQRSGEDRHPHAGDGCEVQK